MTLTKLIPPAYDFHTISKILTKPIGKAFMCRRSAKIIDRSLHLNSRQANDTACENLNADLWASIEHTHSPYHNKYSLQLAKSPT